MPNKKYRYKNLVDRAKGSFLKKEFFEAGILFLLVISSIWLAVETQGLKKADLGPHLFISDIKLQIVDQTNTPAREWTWLKGELLENRTISNVKNTYLAIKLKNTGRLPAVIKTINRSTPYKGIEVKEHEKYLIPGLGETGWILPVEVLFEKKDYSCNEQVIQEYKYNFEYYKLDDPNEIEPINFSVLCTFCIESTSMNSMDCWPTN